MKEEFHENVIRLMGRRMFDEKIRGGSRERECRRFGDIRMVVVPFDEINEDYEKNGYYEKSGDYERVEGNEKIMKAREKVQKNKGAVIYNFNGGRGRRSLVAESNCSDRYGGQIYSYEKEQLKKYAAVGKESCDYGFGNSNLHVFSGFTGESECADFDYTMRITSRILPPRLFATEHIAEADMLTCGDYFSDRNIFNNLEKFNKLPIPTNGYRLTNTAWDGGAVAAFYPGVLKRVGILLKQDFYIVFPSPDEVRIHPALSTDVRQIGRAIRKSNRKLELKAPYDIVTDKVYRYCRSLKMLKEVEFYEW